MHPLWALFLVATFCLVFIQYSLYVSVTLWLEMKKIFGEYSNNVEFKRMKNLNLKQIYLIVSRQL